MKFFTKSNIIACVLLALTIIVQLIPFTNSTLLQSEVEDPGKTWAEIPVGLAGKSKFDWPSEIKYGDFKDWEPEVQNNYPLYGEREVSIFTYVWNPGGALEMHKVNAYIFVQILFIAFGVIAFLAHSSLVKSVFAFIFGATYIWAFVTTLILKSAEELVPYMPTTVLLAVMAVACIVVGVLYIPEWKKEKAENAARKASL